MRPIVLFGAGSIADVVATYVTLTHGADALAGFIVDTEFAQADDHAGRPLVGIDDAATRFPPRDYDAFVALGYHGLNRLREARMRALQGMGYTLARLIAPTAFVAPNAELGPNAMALDGASVEPFARIGMGAFIWSNAVIGHHAVVGDAAWVTAGACVGGDAVLGPRCFLGLNATIGNRVEIGADGFVGAAALVTKSASDGAVFARADTQRHRLDSAAFAKIMRLA